MAKGSRYWAKFYIVLKNGEKFYLEDTISDIEEQIESADKAIRVTLSKWLGGSETICIKRKNIDYYGEIE